MHKLLRQNTHNGITTLGKLITAGIILTVCVFFCKLFILRVSVNCCDN